MRLPLSLLTLAVLAVLASCARPQPAAEPRYEVVAGVRQTMELIIDPAADVIWDSAGSVVSEAGGRIYEVCLACHSQFLVDDSAR